MSWVFVDDVKDAAEAFAEQLGTGTQAVKVSVVTPEQAREQLLSDKVRPAGVLMDVDLANVPGERGSGPGIAQDLRVKQKAALVSEYPIVRFSAREKVIRNVKGDPGSDDLFDLNILKEELAQNRESVQMRLKGLEAVYAGLKGLDPAGKDTLKKITGLEEPQLGRWSHQGFHDRVLSALPVATHVAAGAFMRGFLTPTGLLLNEIVLSYRLGVDVSKSGEAWKELLASLPFQYKGVAGTFFQRWWARGLEDWWFETVKDERALVSLTIDQRIEALSKTFKNLVPMTMPKGSAGDKPWRACALSFEADPPEFVPVDPSEAVRLTPRADLPIWADPLYASLRRAMQDRDLRANRSDLERLERKHKAK